MKLGDRLRLTRSAMGLSLRELENVIGINNSTLCRVESNKPLVYETGKRIEEWLTSVGEPDLCKECQGKGYVFNKEINADNTLS